MNIFSCSVDVDDRCAVVHLNGELDMSTVPRLVEPLRPLATAGRDMLVDFSGIDFFGTVGLTALADPCATRHRSRGVDPAVAATRTGVAATRDHGDGRSLRHRGGEPPLTPQLHGRHDENPSSAVIFARFLPVLRPRRPGLVPAGLPAATISAPRGRCGAQGTFLTIGR